MSDSFGFQVERVTPAPFGVALVCTCACSRLEATTIAGDDGDDCMVVVPCVVGCWWFRWFCVGGSGGYCCFPSYS